MLALITNRKKLYSSPEFNQNDALPKVSIIVPVLNGEKTIGKCLDSLLCLNFPDNIEYIIVDNNSSDGTKDILAKYKHKILA